MIDRNMADERRLVRSFSSGETFLVSLAMEALDGLQAQGRRAG